MTTLDEAFAELDDAGPMLGAVPVYPVEALPAQAQALVVGAARTGLPAALTGGAVLAAMAAAIGGAVQLAVAASWPVRPILWIPLLAPAGAGKSPAQDLAFGPLRDVDANAGDDDGHILHGDVTLEALARELAVSDGAGAADLDELSVLLRGLGEYKRGGGGDRGRFLQLWTGAPWTIRRVGGGGPRNQVRLRINRPTLVICGGLQPRLHELLGGEEDGMRPRWLPHLAAMPEGASIRPVVAEGWKTLLDVLVAGRSMERRWHLGPPALEAFEDFRSVWKREARGDEGASVAAALQKADVHLARVALVLAEAERPCGGGSVTGEIVERAAQIVQFTLDCWRALPTHGSLALSRRDETLDRGVAALVEWLERREGGKADRRKIQQARVGGARTKDELNALLERYDALYPGCVTTQKTSGPTATIVAAPRRTPYLTVDNGNSGIRTDQIARKHGGFDTVDSVNSAVGNSGSGNSAPQGPILVPKPAPTGDSGSASINDVSGPVSRDETAIHEGIRLRLVEPEPDHPYLRVAEAIAAELADGEWHYGVEVRARLVALGLSNNDATVNKAKCLLADQGRPVETEPRSTGRGAAKWWRMTPAQIDNPNHEGQNA